MYFNFLGGSALLHLLAAYPKVVAALGIAATVAMLVTPTGTHNYLGSGQQMQALERVVSADQSVDEETLAEIAERARQLASRPRPEIEAAVRWTLRECGTGCANLTPAIVMGDRELLEMALLAAELDRMPTALSPLTSQQIEALIGRR